VPRLPLTLPGDASAAAVRADASDWIVGARPGRATARLARAYGARGFGAIEPGAYVVARGRARAFAAALSHRHALVYAQPDALRAPAQAAPFPLDPLDDLQGYRWRDHVVSPSLAAPTRTRLIALVDAAADVSHPDLASGRISTTGGHPVTIEHGTATASVAAAPRNGIGLTGLWPGGRALNVALGTDISCADSANGIIKAIRHHAAVINMSYGSSALCVPEYLALEAAYARGIVPVAAAGNEFNRGNPLEFPATLPHVVTVGALDPSDEPSTFSNANAAVDVSAPGVCIPTAVPLGLRVKPSPGCPEGPSGYAYLSGTSFSAPMVAAAIAWVRAARPRLRADQAVDAVRFSARDVGPSGFDAETGFGELSVDGALARKAGPHDPGEPNDGPGLVDGSLLPKQALLFTGQRTVHRRATVDATEDPADWYRIAIPAHRRAHLDVHPRAGNPDLLVRRRHGDSYPVVARSAHRGGHRERVTLRNRTGSREIRYVGVSPGGGARLDAAYTLSVSR
jgi:hypothetical protein